MRKTERFNKARAYADMIRGNADMSSFRRVPYHMVSTQVHRSRSCTIEFPCSIGDVVYEAYAGRVYPITVIGFLITQFGCYALVTEESNALERKIHLDNTYLSPKEAAKAAKRKERARYEKNKD